MLCTMITFIPGRNIILQKKKSLTNFHPLRLPTAPSNLPPVQIKKKALEWRRIWNCTTWYASFHNQRKLVVTMYGKGAEKSRRPIQYR